MITLELKPTFEEKLASFATKFVPDLVNDICRLAEKAQNNPVIVHLLDEWYENSIKYESLYKSSILEALEGKKNSITLTEMTRIYKSKAFAANDILMDYFIHNGFEKEEE